MTEPHVVVDVPGGWRAATVAPPKINESSGAAIAQFAAFTNEVATITIGCVATPIPGWSEEMRPAVEGRNVALAGSSAAIASGTPIDAKSGEHGVFVLRSANDLEGPPVGSARTWLGWDAAHVHTCFATCTGPSDHGASCQNSIETAHLEGSTRSPPPGLALSAVEWAVNHPKPFATGAAAFVILAGIAAVLTRRKPRFRTP